MDADYATAEMIAWGLLPLSSGIHYLLRVSACISSILLEVLTVTYYVNISIVVSMITVVK